MATACPVSLPIDTMAPEICTSELRETGEGDGSAERKRSMIGATSEPMIESIGPHMPASHKNAVPPGRTRSSLV